MATKKPATKKPAAKKTAAKKAKAGAPASKKSKKPKFTVQQLKDIFSALKANPATTQLADRVIEALNDPGVSVPPPN
jgi:hypothetical protein